MSFAPDTILLLHPPSLSPYPFVSRLVGRTVDDEELVVPWTIDNKYYTAEVNIQLLELEDDGVIPPGVEVLVYLFDSIPRTLPYALAQSMVNDPKDVALAIKTSPAAVTNDDGTTEELELPSKGVMSQEDMEDMFAELGLELVDETAEPEEDDERPLSPMETVRQTLMTHLWRGMVRKPSGSRSGGLPTFREAGEVDDDDYNDDEAYDNGHSDDEGQTGAGPSTFPISFRSLGATSANGVLSDATSLSESTGESHAGKAAASNPFPGLAELKAQIEMDDLDRFERTGGFGAGFGEGTGEMGMRSRVDRLDMLDELLGAEPGQEEYARLEEWLDDDDDTGMEGVGRVEDFAPLEDGEDRDHGDEDGSYQDFEGNGPGVEDQARDIIARDNTDPARTDGDETFDDDFDDFAAFQSAPQRDSAAATIDPAPLLYHLQAVRAELAGLGEEERRERAGKEVARVMRDLGFDAGDVGDLLASSALSDS